MSGHSKWAQIKRKKAVTDSKRGALFTKMGKNIAIAAKQGKDPDMNPALRAAIEYARAYNLPKDNIEKAILKGAGELPGVVYEEMRYEGYGPGGIALIMECVTDNTNRTVSTLRRLLSDSGGSLGNSGSVLYMFQQKGVIRIAKEDLGQQQIDTIELAAIDAGAEDIKNEEEGITITCAREQLSFVVNKVQESGVSIASSGMEWVTSNKIEPSPEDKERLEKLIESLEEDEDVNYVYTNAIL
ncbi:MAG TPA: YebC/PmpR family DNA-binding transcriptional regulator [Patescibacteria group bacterium]|nr:YebC/PmpR family DNA-binding transcriptional regulator [Patescibacteria group bacterium]